MAVLLLADDQVRGEPPATAAPPPTGAHAYELLYTLEAADAPNGSFAMDVMYGADEAVQQPAAKLVTAADDQWISEYMDKLGRSPACEECDCCGAFASEDGWYGGNREKHEDLASVVVHQLLYRLRYRSRAEVAKVRYSFRKRAKWKSLGGCTALHIRRTDKLFGPCVRNPRNPAFRTIPGFNRSWENYMEVSSRFMAERNSSRLFVLSDDSMWVQSHLLDGSAMTTTLGAATLSGHGLMTWRDPDKPPGYDVSDKAFTDSYKGERHRKMEEVFTFFSSLQVASTCASTMFNSASMVSNLLRYTPCVARGKCIAREAMFDLRHDYDETFIVNTTIEWDTQGKRC